MSGKIEIGAFTIDGDVVTGPADYMKERGNDRLRAIEAGTDVVFNMGMGRAPSALYASLTGMDGTPLSPDPETAILVSLQTDYAAWKGARQAQSFLDRSAALQARYGEGW